MKNGNGKAAANGAAAPKTIRCGIYTRKSTDEGLQQEFNSLDAQREAGEAFILSQRHEGWQLLPARYDDGGYTGGNMERPAIKRLLGDIDAGKVDCVVVYKVDRLSRSLLDFARIMELFDKRGVSFVSVTQQFNTTNSIGRLTLNILLSFAQFEREIISERTRDKQSAARRKGKWIGGHPVLGYDIDPRGGRLIVNAAEALRVRGIFDLYLEHQAALPVIEELRRRDWRTKRWESAEGRLHGDKPFTKNRLYGVLENVIYTGRVDHKGTIYDGEHEAIVDRKAWDRVQKLLGRNSAARREHVRNRYGALLHGLAFFGATGAACGAGVGVSAWMAFQIRETAVLRSVNFLTGLRLSKGTTPAKAFQTSGKRASGQSAESLANSFSVAKWSWPSGTCSAAAKAVMLLSGAIVNVVMVFSCFKTRFRRRSGAPRRG